MALAGDDVILPCHLEPPINVSSETVIWTRTDLDPKYIHYHEDGRTVHWSQNPSYHYRTRLFEGELKNGNVSIKISKVKLSDAGKYFCILDSMKMYVSIQLTVGAASDPSTMGRSIKTGEMIVVCEAKGWYPEPELFWLDSEGNLLSAGPTETVRGPDDLYTVSRRLTVRKSDSFTCRVQQKNINQTRETHFYVPEDFFTVQFSWRWIIIIISLSIIILLLVLVIIVTVKHFKPSQLICSHQPIMALAGDDVILTCHLEPAINARSQTVIWTRTDLYPNYIHYQEDGRPVHWSQNPSYKYRTILFDDELMNGNVSMKIFRVKLSDAGKYFCILSSMQKEASIQLTVGAVSDPSIMDDSVKIGEMILVCEAKGWYPEPELFWLDGEGNLLSAGPTETVRGPDDLYTVSRRLTVEKSDTFTCRVQQKNINQTREREVYIPEQSKLICSHQPIVVLSGDDVILPCHLEPPIDADSETVIWTRTDLDPKYIHYHKDGRLNFKNQNPSYHYRTRLFVDEMPNGNVSMKIFRVKLSDTGEYKCSLPSMMKEASIQLTVGAVSTPVIEFVSNQSREVVLQCEAKGWYPEPELFWLDGEGNLLSAGPTETVRGPDDLYTVSRRLTVRKSDSFTCRVQQKSINQTRETHFYVPG
ncbi:Butyrophilin-like protein 2 [Nibea albiflora]|uniref:Butyrophilin-like protein 2 n=1 Tax=Nibea albiflora TaxID=240163 RepID=A0ACB7EUP9_NIBAL|nr:Butyrophilin-like protein 2 [Nibea albiflora]